VTYNEILFQAKYFGSQIQYGSPIIPAAIVAGVLYIGMCLILAAVAKWLEKRLSRKPGAAIIPAAAVPPEL
jgi:glutamate transport system permease protein